MESLEPGEGRSPLHLVAVTASGSRRAGGLFYSVRRLCQTLSACGARVDVVTLEDDETAADLPHWSPLKPTVLPRRLGFGYSPGLKRAIERSLGAQAVCHVHGIWLYPSKAAMDVSLRRGAPRIVSPRGMLDPWALKTSAWKKRIAGALYEGRSLRSAECLHALCESELEGMREFGLKNPVAVVPNGTDLPGPPPADWRDPAPADWAGKKIVLFLGRIHPKKGLLPLVEAWSKVKSDGEDWRLAIAGPSELGHREEVQARIDRCGLGGRIRCVGPQFGAAKDAWLRRADAFALTSYSEGFPMAVLEAMAYGLPAVLSPECNVPAAAAHGASLECKVDVDDVATALRTLFRTPDEALRAMGARGRALVAQEYAWERVAGRMMEVYAWMLGRGERPAFVHAN
jgi:poly(glycerol-phosphate) alpha-glucosyltransferase